MSITIETIMSVDPAAVDRANRLDHTMHLLRNGTTPKEARRLLVLRYKVSVATAWRTVDAAMDMVEMPSGH